MFHGYILMTTCAIYIYTKVYFYVYFLAFVRENDFCGFFHHMEMYVCNNI